MQSFERVTRSSMPSQRLPPAWSPAARPRSLAGAPGLALQLATDPSPPEGLDLERLPPYQPVGGPVPDDGQVDLLLSYHTSDHLDEPFYAPGGIYSRYPTANYYGWHL